MPTLFDRLRTLWGSPSAASSSAGPGGFGLFRVGGDGGSSISTGWNFQRIANQVYGNPTGFRCVEAIASNFSRPAWQVTKPGSSEPIPDHPLLTLLNRPNPSMSGTMMQRAIARDLELTGRSFWVKGQGVDGWGYKGPVTSLRRMPAQRMTVLGNEDDELCGFSYTDRVGHQVPIVPDAVLYLRYPHPEKAFDGLAPALVAGLSAETDNASSRFNRELLSNDAALPGYLMVKGLTPDQFEEWSDRWKRGEMPGKTRFLDGDDAKYVRVAATNQELTYDVLRRASQDDILRSFGVPRAVAFDVENTTYANADAEKALFMQQNIHPKWVLVSDEMTLQLGQDQGVVIGFELNGIDELQDSRDAVVERAVKLLGYQAQTINELRKSMGWSPVPWGDEPIVPIQPMSAVPVQPPAAPELPSKNGSPKESHV